MWAAMLRRLPEFPPELEYRFVCPDLVLMVDILPSVVDDVLCVAVPTIETAPPVTGGPLT